MMYDDVTVLMMMGMMILLLSSLFSLFNKFLFFLGEQVEFMSVAQLKEEIAALGGSVDGCYERGEVEEKLREVRQGGTVRWKASSETGVEGSAADQMPGGAGEEEEEEEEGEEEEEDIHAQMMRARQKRAQKQARRKGFAGGSLQDEDEDVDEGVGAGGGDEALGAAAAATRKGGGRSGGGSGGNGGGGGGGGSAEEERAEEDGDERGRGEETGENGPGLRVEYKIQKKQKKEFEVLDIKYKARRALEALCTHDFLRQGKQGKGKGAEGAGKKVAGTAAWATVQLEVQACPPFPLCGVHFRGGFDG